MSSQHPNAVAARKRREFTLTSFVVSSADEKLNESWVVESWKPTWDELLSGSRCSRHTDPRRWCPDCPSAIKALSLDARVRKMVRRQVRADALTPQRFRSNGVKADVLSLDRMLEQGGEKAEAILSAAAEVMWPGANPDPETIRAALEAIAGKSLRELERETGISKSQIQRIVHRWRQELNMTKLEELLSRQEQLQERLAATMDGMDDVCRRLREQFPNDSEVAQAVEQFLADIS